MTLIVGAEWLENRGRDSSDFELTTDGIVTNDDVSVLYVDGKLGRPYNGGLEPVRAYNRWDNAVKAAERK
jgi:hypothetical protein